MNIVIYILLGLVCIGGGGMFGVGYSYAMMKVCRHMSEILESVNFENNAEFIEGVIFVSDNLIKHM